MSVRSSNYQTRFPLRHDSEGRPLCRVCGMVVKFPRRSSCSTECSKYIERACNWDIMRRYILKRDGNICRACGATVTLDRRKANTAHVDHIIPIAQGGDMWDETNLQVLCPACNLSKGNKTMEQWSAHKAALEAAESEKERLEIERANYVQSMPLFDGVAIEND